MRLYFIASSPIVSIALVASKPNSGVLAYSILAPNTCILNNTTCNPATGSVLISVVARGGGGGGGHPRYVFRGRWGLF